LNVVIMNKNDVRLLSFGIIDLYQIFHN